MAIVPSSSTSITPQESTGPKVYTKKITIFACPSTPVFMSKIAAVTDLPGLRGVKLLDLGGCKYLCQLERASFQQHLIGHMEWTALMYEALYESTVASLNDCPVIVRVDPVGVSCIASSKSCIPVYRVDPPLVLRTLWRSFRRAARASPLRNRQVLKCTRRRSRSSHAHRRQCSCRRSQR